MGAVVMDKFLFTNERAHTQGRPTGKDVIKASDRNNRRCVVMLGSAGPVESSSLAGEILSCVESSGGGPNRNFKFVPIAGDNDLKEHRFGKTGRHTTTRIGNRNAMMYAETVNQAIACFLRDGHKFFHKAFGIASAGNPEAEKVRSITRAADSTKYKTHVFAAAVARGHVKLKSGKPAKIALREAGQEPPTVYSFVKGDVGVLRECVTLDVEGKLPPSVQNVTCLQDVTSLELGGVPAARRQVSAGTVGQASDSTARPAVDKVQRSSQDQSGSGAGGL